MRVDVGFAQWPETCLVYATRARRPANTRWVEVPRPARTQRNHRAVTFPPALRFLEVVGHETLIHNPPKDRFREAMLTKRRFWKAKPTVPSAFSTQLSTIRSPNRVLTPLKSMPSRVKRACMPSPASIHVANKKLRNFAPTT